MNGRLRARWLAGALLALAHLLLVLPQAVAAVDHSATTDSTDSPAPPPPRIGVVTMGPGEVFFERFGHDALVVAEAGEEPLSYNYGYFDPAEPDFIANFARGRMMYWLMALPLAEDLAYYRDVGRGATLQWLDLRPAQARALADHLAWQAQPQNARYRYDYYQANCATMVRDALDRALDGQLQAQLAGRSAGNTWRSESVRLARPSPWMWLGFDLALGPAADRPLSRWEEAFVPMRLADSLRQAVNSDGRPLVAEEVILLPHRLPPEPAEAGRRSWPWLLIGLALAAGLLASARHRRVLAVAAGSFWAVTGLFGVVLAGLWLGTEHTAGWANRNLLLCSPLALALLPAAWAWWHRRSPARVSFILALLLLGGCLAALLLYGLQVRPQAQLGWIALLTPIHAALAWCLRPASPAPPERQ